MVQAASSHQGTTPSVCRETQAWPQPHALRGHALMVSLQCLRLPSHLPLLLDARPHGRPTSFWKPSDPF